MAAILSRPYCVKYQYSGQYTHMRIWVLDHEVWVLKFQYSNDVLTNMSKDISGLGNLSAP